MRRPSIGTTPTLDAEVESAAADLEAVLVNGLPEPLGHHPPRLSRNSLQDEDKLVAAEAGDLVPRPAKRPEEVRELDEDRSPAACPRVSLTTLKWSRSRRTIDPGVPRRARATTRSRLSSTERRFPRSVSGSWRAR